MRRPECGADAYEDADRCPRCGHYLTPDLSPWSGRPLWWILLGLARRRRHGLVYAMVTGDA